MLCPWCLQQLPPPSEEEETERTAALQIDIIDPAWSALADEPHVASWFGT